MAKAQDIIDGMAILLRHTASDAHIGGAQPDIILGPPATLDAPNENELSLLQTYGWFWSEEFECWAHFC